MAYIGKRPVDTFPATNAITSTLISENAVGSSEIATNAVTTLQIADNAVTAVKIAENVISSRELAANTVATGNIADNAVDGTKIAQNSILTRHIDDGQVTTDQLGADAVTAAKLADDAVVTANIVDANVTTAKLADDAVTAAKITDNAVGAAALNISGNGTSGQALLSDGDGSFSYGANVLTTEEVQDIAGGMFSGNTETGITATYQDADGTIDLVVGTLNQDTTGNAATATALETARTIGGTSFDGTANIAVNLAATATALATARTIHGVSFDGTANIDLSEVVQDTAGAMFSSNTETNITATYQDSDGTVDLAVEQQLNNTSAPYYHKIVVTVVSDGGNKYALDGGTQAVAKLTPNVVYRFDQSDSSNSSHPLRLGTAANGSEITAGYTIYNKVGTPGSAGAYTEVALEQDAPGQLYYWCSAHSGMGASVSVADESFLTQTLTNKTLTSPNITGLSLGGVAVTSTAAELNYLDITTLGTSEASKAVTADANGDILIPDSDKLKFGAGSDLQIFHDGSNSIIADAGTGDLFLAGTQLRLTNGGRTATYLQGTDGGAVDIRYNNSTKLATSSDGIDVTGHIDAATLTTTGNITVGGNLTINGSTTTTSSTNTTIADRLIELGTGTTGTPANDMGIVLERGDSNNAFIGWDESTDKFTVGTGTFTGASTGDLTITTGTLVANLEGNVTGNVTGNLTGTASAIADNSVTSAKIVNGTIVAADIANATITTTQIAANTIATGNVADNAIDGTKIAQNSILTRHIDDAQVTADQLASGAVTTAKLGADAVTAAKLADDAVVTANIVDANVTTAKIADANVTTAKIADNSITAAKLNITGNGTSGQAVLSDGDGSFSYGSSGKTTEEIQDIVGAMVSSNTETNISVTYQDADGTIDFVVPNTLTDVTELGTLTTLTVDDIKINGTQIGHTSDEDAMSIASNGVVTFTQIPVLPNDSITQAFIADDAVGADQLAVNSVVSASIVNGSIVSADIAANTIATSNIADNAIDGTKIASNSILTRHIDDNQITGDQIADDIVLSGTGAIRMPDGTTAQRPGSPAAGMFRYNTTDGKFEGYTDSWGEIGGGGSNGFLTDIFDGTTTPATDGSRVAFTLSQSVSDEKFLMVFIDGVYQAHDAYSVSGSTLTMADAPVSGRVLTVHSVSAAVQGDGLNVDNFSGDGSDTTFTLSLDPTHENNTQVYIDGVYQFKNTYSVSGTTLTFSTAPPNGSAIEVMTHSQTTVNSAASLNATAISNLSEVSIASADHLMIFDATDSTLKKGLASDLIEQLTTEQVQDVIGGMVTSNTESGITVAYDDSDGTLDFTVGTLNQNTTGSAATLTTPRGINGVNFDGSADITVTAAAGTLSGNTLASGVTASSLTSVGTLTGLTTTGATINTNALRLASLDTSVGDEQSIGDIEFYASDSSTGGTGVQAKISSLSDSAFGVSYALSFETGSGASPSEKMRISSAGRVSIDKSAYIKQVAITSSSNAVAWDSQAAANAYHVTTENTTFSAPSNAVEGAIIQVEIAQGGTARTIAWNTVFEFAASTAPTVTATANKTDIFTFRYNGSVWQEIGRVQNLAQT